MVWCPRSRETCTTRWPRSVPQRALLPVGTLWYCGAGYAFLCSFIQQTHWRAPYTPSRAHGRLGWDVAFCTTARRGRVPARCTKEPEHHGSTPDPWLMLSCKATVSYSINRSPYQNGRAMGMTATGHEPTCELGVDPIATLRDSNVLVMLGAGYAFLCSSIRRLYCCLRL